MTEAGNLETPAGPERRRIAVIGSGVSGLAAAWLLASRHDVTLYEKEARAGGHSNTVEVPGPDGPIAVDTGFIVYNETNYPNLTALFRHLGVATKPSDMSFAASIGGGAFEYASADLNGLLGQRSNVVSLRFWRMVRGMLGFYGEAKRLAPDDVPDDLSLGAFLAARGSPSPLVDDHILPMCAAIWSTTPERIRDFPLRSFLRFFSTHGLLDLGRTIKWRTVEGGSREYVSRMVAALGGGARMAEGVRRIGRTGEGVVVEAVSGRRETFDDAVVATHADEALRLLDDPSAEERALLGAFAYTDNLAVLHDDAALMPRRRRVWASWNFLGAAEGAPGEALSVTYWMNRLQSLDPRRPLFVTLNPRIAPRESAATRSFSYSHPLFDAAALKAQRDLWRLQGRRRTWYAGAYFGYGFHEDGLQAGLAAAEALGGVRRPWSVADESGRIALPAERLEAAE